jgi:hypothetical protein
MAAAGPHNDICTVFCSVTEETLAPCPLLDPWQALCVTCCAVVCCALADDDADS